MFQSPCVQPVQAMFSLLDKRPEQTGRESRRTHAASERKSATTVPAVPTQSAHGQQDKYGQPREFPAIRWRDTQTGRNKKAVIIRCSFRMKEYKYFRYLSPDWSRGNMAELYTFDAAGDTLKPKRLLGNFVAPVVWRGESFRR